MNFPSLIEKQSIATHRFKLNIWDVGGQKSLRSYWRNYFESTDGLIWVVDSVDRRRLADCKEELKGHPSRRGTTCLSGIHIHFFSESLARQVSLMAYLPGYNLGCANKNAELCKRMVKKLCAT